MRDTFVVNPSSVRFNYHSKRTGKEEAVGHPPPTSILTSRYGINLKFALGILPVQLSRLVTSFAGSCDWCEICSSEIDC